MVSQIHVQIPSGHKALAGLQISVPGAILVPAAGSNVQYIFGDNDEFDYFPGLVIDGPPYKLMFRGYNNDPFLSHSFVVRVTADKV